MSEGGIGGSRCLSIGWRTWCTAPVTPRAWTDDRPRRSPSAQLLVLHSRRPIDDRHASHIGVDHIMVEVDYPHADQQHRPETHRRLSPPHRGHLPPCELRAICSGEHGTTVSTSAARPRTSARSRSATQRLEHSRERHIGRTVRLTTVRPSPSDTDRSRAATPQTATCRRHSVSFSPRFGFNQGARPDMPQFVIRGLPRSLLDQSASDVLRPHHDLGLVAGLAPTGETVKGDRLVDEIQFSFHAPILGPHAPTSSASCTLTANMPGPGPRCFGCSTRSLRTRPRFTLTTPSFRITQG